MKKINPRKVITAIILSILSLLLPGTGHLFGARIGRFIFVCLLFVVLISIGGIIVGFNSYRTGVAILYLSVLCWYGFLGIDSYLVNRKKSGIVLKWYNKWYFYIFGITFLFFVTNIQTIAITSTGIRLFHIPNVSNSPVLQKNDIFIAKMNYGLKQGFHFVKFKSFGNITFTAPFIAFHTTKYSVGDFVLFEAPNKTLWVKRIVALGGDRFEIHDGKDYLNGKLVKSYYIPSKNRQAFKSIKFGPVTIPPHYVLFLGDNRDNSMDSREIGAIPSNLLRGKALFVFWSANYKRIGQLL